MPLLFNLITALNMSKLFNPKKYVGILALNLIKKFVWSLHELYGEEMSLHGLYGV